MYGTWRYTSNGDNATLIRDTPATPRACNNCRKKKVKCTREPTGCSRCNTLGISCTYNSAKGAEKRAASNGVAHDQTVPAQQPRRKKSCPRSASFHEPTPENSNEWLDLFPMAVEIADDSSLDRFQLDFPDDTSPCSHSLNSTDIPALNKTGNPPSTLQAVTDVSEEFPDFPSIPQPTSSSLSNAGPSQVPLCQCLRRVVFLIDELEWRMSNDKIEKIDNLASALAVNKEAVQYGERMATCASCSTTIENMTLLTFLTERLAALCEHVVNTYLSSRESSSTTPTTRLDGELPGVRNMVSGDWSELPPKVILIGDYEVDTRAECEIIFKVLIILQLEGLNSLIARTSGMEIGQWRSELTSKKIKMMLDRMEQA